MFNLAATQPRRSLSIAGCRNLARQFRERVEARQSRAIVLVGRSRASPFDLHALLPVPDFILQLGPAHPDALAWLPEHWGTTDGLRRVVERWVAARLPAGHAVVGYSFFTIGDTPHSAVTQLAARWPVLQFALQPWD